MLVLTRVCFIKAALSAVSSKTVIVAKKNRLKLNPVAEMERKNRFIKLMVTFYSNNFLMPGVSK